MNFALVTGASRIVAFEIVKEVGARSAVVRVCSKSTASAHKSASVISGEALAQKLKVTRVHTLSEFVPLLAERLEQSNISIYTANYPFNRIIWNEMVLKGLGGDFDNLVEVNLNRTLMLSQSVVRHMLGEGNIGGFIIIIIIIIIIVSFTPTIAGKTMGAPNSMAKSGIIAITKYIVLDNNRDGWAHTFEVVDISTVVTFSYMTLAERKNGAIENSIKRGRHQTEFATIALSMTSDDFSFVDGKSIVIGRGTVVVL